MVCYVLLPDSTLSTIARLSAKDLTDLVISNGSLAEKATFNEYCIALICLRSISYFSTSLFHYLFSYNQAVFPYIMQNMHPTLQSLQIFLFHEISILALVLVRPAMLIILTVRSNGFVDSIKCYFTTEIIQVTPLTCAILCSQYSHKHSRI